MSNGKSIMAQLTKMGLETPASEVVAELEKVGVKVTPIYVNNVKFRMRKGTISQKSLDSATVEVSKVRGKRKNRRAVVSPVQSEFDTMLALKKFGTLDELQATIDKMRQIAA